MIRYFGTKSSTVEQVYELVSNNQGPGTFADAFGGLGTIGSHFKKHGYTVSTCDVLHFPNAFQVSRIECNKQPSFSLVCKYLNIHNSTQLKDYLNSLSSRDSWLIREYSKKRLFFLAENASKISAVWNSIRKWNRLGLIDYKERAFLIASLLNSTDRVANTAGTYYAYLKQFDRKAKNKFVFEWIGVNPGKHLGQAILGDALASLSSKKFDILYLDPPYNRRNYANYYHLPETLAQLKAKRLKHGSLSGIPVGKHKSTDSILAAAGESYISKLITDVKWKYLVFHYCPDGVIPIENVQRMLRKQGDVVEHSVSALGYTTKKKARRHNQNLFIVSNA